MPIYEFACEDCSKDSEQLIRTTDWQKDAQCPHCGSRNLDKKLSVFSASPSGDMTSESPPCSGVPSSCGRCSLDN